MSRSRRQLLAAYDDQLRTDAETPSALAVTRLGPLRLATFAGGRGFITYRDLGGATQAQIRSLVRDALVHFSGDLQIEEVEWKTRAHDVAPGLHSALGEAGFVAQDCESIMLGEAETLATEVPIPAGVTVRRVETEADARAVSAMVDRAFGDPVSERRAQMLIDRLARRDGTEQWVAEVDGTMVTGGRLEPVPGSEFAGIWGGATLPEWRGKGIYRALTAARARSALDMGKTLIRSDSTEYSRPILERSGLVKVSETTPYVWRRAE